MHGNKLIDNSTNKQSNKSTAIIFFHGPAADGGGVAVLLTVNGGHLNATGGTGVTFSDSSGGSIYPSNSGTSSTKRYMKAE